MFRFSNFNDIERLFFHMLNEFSDSLREIVDVPTTDTKEASPPTETKQCCCGESCSCTKDLNECASKEKYVSTSTDVLPDSYQQISDDDEDAVPQYSKEELKPIATNPSWKCTTFDNWVNIGDGVWTCSVLAMVCNENININLLDNSRVYIEYDEEFSTPDNNDNYTHHHYVSGSYVFPLPPNVDTSTFKARRDGDFIKLSISEKKEALEASCIRINIQD